MSSNFHKEAFPLTGITPKADNSQPELEEVKRTQDELAFINRLDRIITSSLDISGVSEGFAEELRQVMDVDWVSIVLIERDELHSFALSTKIGSLWRQGENIFLKGTGIEWVAKHRQTLMVPDLSQESKFWTGEYHLKQGVRSIVYLPLILKHEVFGALLTASRRPHAYGERELSLLEHVAKQIARLYGENKLIDATTHKLKSTGAKVLGQELVSEPPVAPKKLAPSQEKPTKPKDKLLRQIPQPEVLRLIPEVMARRCNAIPLSVSGNTLQVAMVDPTDVFALEAFAIKSRMRIKPVAASAKEVSEAIDFNYKAYGEIEKRISLISTPGEATDDRLAIDAVTSTPLAQALNLIVEEAVKARSSDVHFEPEENRLRVRYRIDGILHDMISLPLSIHRSLISRIKILGGMNIADHYHPQDGQFSAEVKGREVDIRVASAPSVYGEMAVLRLLDKSMATRGLHGLGFLPDSLARYEGMLKTPYGMILIGGPTGAGKTTTLYASINSLDTISRNIITIEDPAEYRFKGVNQIQVNNRAGITFATGLKSILRLDPDVIMIGEIRDAETANIAIQAALTGHLVLSSIHANDAVGMLSRFLDLGVDPFLIASAVIGAVAQRMVRCICPDCGHHIGAPLVERIAYEREMGEEKVEFLYGIGCESCVYTGYLGRTGIFEILPITDAIRTMLIGGSSSTDIRAQALKEGMIPMMKDGMFKVEGGITTPAEVLRTVYSPEWHLGGSK